MKALDVRALLDAPHWPPDRRLDTILGSLMRRRDVALPDVPPDAADIWEPFADVSRDVLARCAVDRLSEALMVEKLGLACCAKMTLLSETEEERMLYSMMAADEATHLFWISHFIAEPAPASPFLQLLADVVENGTKTEITLIVQAVLEGWGVEHYKALARGCTDAKLCNVLRLIVTDEVRHHESGAQLLRRRAVTDDERERIIDTLDRLLSMVRCGPQSVVAAIRPRSRDEAVRWFEQLEDETPVKLALLRGLIAETGVHGVIEALDARDAFLPITPSECADLCSIS